MLLQDAIANDPAFNLANLTGKACVTETFCSDAALFPDPDEDGAFPGQGDLVFEASSESAMVRDGEI